MLTPPSPADYPDGGFMDAYNDYQRHTTCSCGYGPFDSCPNCD